MGSWTQKRERGRRRETSQALRRDRHVRPVERRKQIVDLSSQPHPPLRTVTTNSINTWSCFLQKDQTYRKKVTTKPTSRAPPWPTCLKSICPTSDRVARSSLGTFHCAHSSTTTSSFLRPRLLPRWFLSCAMRRSWRIREFCENCSATYHQSAGSVNKPLRGLSMPM